MQALNKLSDAPGPFSGQFSMEESWFLLKNPDFLLKNRWFYDKIGIFCLFTATLVSSHYTMHNISLEAKVLRISIEMAAFSLENSTEKWPVQ